MLIKYIDFHGKETDAEVSAGTNLMQAALDNMVDGILGDCGGACSCATCHVYVDDAWMATVGKADDVEASMLDMAIDPQPNSRLSCQIIATDAMDGMVLRLPKAQF